MGCSSSAGKADEPSAEEMVSKQLQSDRAGSIFAQQELALAQAQVSLAQSKGEPVTTKSVAAAEAHWNAAQFVLKMDEEDALWQRDVSAWKRYVKATSPDIRN